jgi:hypothetical protein
MQHVRPRFAPSHVALGLSLAVVAALGAPRSEASQLIAIGTLTGTADLSGLNGLLEDGLAATALGGTGSGLAYAGGNTFLSLPDRGPNKVAWGGTTGFNVDNTTSYISRFQTVTMGLAAAPSGALPFTLTPTLSATTLLFSTTALNYGSAPVPTINTGSQYYFTGRSDAFGTGSSLAATDARFDPEGIRVSNDGKSVFISDEYGPYVYQFDRATGERIRTFALPAAYGIANKNSLGTAEISSNTVNGRITNKGMEGLAISPDGKSLIGFMQSPLAQDGGDVATGENGRYNRLVKIDIATGQTHEYVYDNKITTDPTTGATVNRNFNSSEIIAVNDNVFLVLERDGVGLGGTAPGATGAIRKVYKIDLSGATELPAGAAGASTLATYAVEKTQFIDLRAALNALGITDAQIPSKLEGLAFGQDVVIDGVTKHTLYVSNDNDYAPTDCNLGVCNTNNFYVFAFDDTELPGYQAQAVAPVPLPAAGWLLVSGLGALGAAARRRRQGGSA